MKGVVSGGWYVFAVFRRRPSGNKFQSHLVKISGRSACLPSWGVVFGEWYVLAVFGQRPSGQNRQSHLIKIKDHKVCLPWWGVVSAGWYAFAVFGTRTPKSQGHLPYERVKDIDHIALICDLTRLM